MVLDKLNHQKTMPYQRKTYSPQFKFDRALEAIKNDNLSEISRKYNIGANLISKWRAHLIEQGPCAFETTPNQENNALKGKVAKLEQMVGKKEVELSLIKNFSDFYQSQNTP